MGFLLWLNLSDYIETRISCHCDVFNLMTILMKFNEKWNRQPERDPKNLNDFGLLSLQAPKWILVGFESSPKRSWDGERDNGNKFLSPFSLTPFVTNATKVPAYVVVAAREQGCGAVRLNPLGCLNPFNAKVPWPSQVAPSKYSWLKHSAQTLRSLWKVYNPSTYLLSTTICFFLPLLALALVFEDLTRP